MPACAPPRVSERAPPPRPAPCAPSLAPRALRAPPRASAPRGAGGSGSRPRTGVPGRRSPSGRPASGGAGEGAPPALVGVREGARGSGWEPQAWEGEGPSESVERGVCKVDRMCERAARPAGRCVSEVRGEGGLGDGNFLAASWSSPAPCAFPGGALAPRPAPRPALPGDRRRVWSGNRGEEPGRLGPGTSRALVYSAPRGICSGPGPQFPGPCGRRKGGARSQPLGPRPVRREPRRGRQPDARSCALFWEVPEAPERPRRGQVAGGGRAGEGAARPGRVPAPERRRSRCAGVPRAPGRAAEERGPCERRKQRDRRKRQGWDERCPARGWGRSQADWRPAASSGARLEDCWLEPSPSQEMK